MTHKERGENIFNHWLKQNEAIEELHKATDQDVFEWHEMPKLPAYNPENVMPGDIIQCAELDRTFIFDDGVFIVISRIYIGKRVSFPKEKGIKLLKGKTLAVCYAAINE